MMGSLSVPVVSSEYNTQCACPFLCHLAVISMMLHLPRPATWYGV